MRGGWNEQQETVGKLSQIRWDAKPFCQFADFVTRAGALDGPHDGTVRYSYGTAIADATNRDVSFPWRPSTLIKCLFRFILLRDGLACFRWPRSAVHRAL